MSPKLLDFIFHFWERHKQVAVFSASSLLLATNVFNGERQEKIDNSQKTCADIEHKRKDERIHHYDVRNNERNSTSSETCKCCCCGNSRTIAINFASGFSNLFDFIRPKVVRIYLSDKPSSFIGSGFIYKAEGLVLTAAHIFGDLMIDNNLKSICNEELRVKLSNGKIFPARIVGISYAADIAILKILDADSVCNENKIFHHLPLDSLVKGPKQGEFIVAYGATENSDECVGLVGTVSQSRQSFLKDLSKSSDYTQNIPFLQLAIITLPGMSGSPVCDIEGNVVGLVIKKFKDYGLALPIRFVKKVADSIEKYGSWSPPTLGIIIKVNNEKEIDYLNTPHKGINVEYVESKSIAEEAGIQPGDLIISINGVTTLSSRDIFEQIESSKGSLLLQILRNNKIRCIKVTV